MKLLLRAGVFLLLTMHAWSSSGPAVRFAEALQSYKSGQYSEAISLLESLARDGHAGYEVQYNLGNAYYKNGDIGKSVLAFQRALRLRPTDEDATHNLNVVLARTRDRVEPMPLLFFVQWWNDLKMSRLPDDFLLWSVIFLWLTAAAAFVFFGFRSTFVRRLALVGGVLIALCFAASFSLYSERLADFHQRNFAVVMAAQLSVKSAPDESGIESFIIHEGLTVEILERRDEQLLIRLADGKQGWIPSSQIERI
ncbi:MAG: tetratricopeptide repeat protein [Bacteroidia bacterium]|nr:tetratricopeptide repeat protein [Bacteroidia bacterium]